jgi:hypothetical protein
MAHLNMLGGTGQLLDLAANITAPTTTIGVWNGLNADPVES